MDVANLQIEGLVMAVAAINRALVEKGVLSRSEIETALAVCEAGVTSAERAVEDLTPSNRDAVAFTIRLLRLANEETGYLDFSSLAREVGRTKGRYNDQQ